MSAESAEGSSGVTGLLHQRLEMMMSEMYEAKKQMERYRDRAETAEEDHRALANIIETMRRDDWKNTTEDFKHRSQSDSGLVKELCNASVMI